MSLRTAILGTLFVALAFGSAFVLASPGGRPPLAQATGSETIAVQRDLAAIPFLAPHGPPPRLPERGRPPPPAAAAREAGTPPPPRRTPHAADAHAGAAGDRAPPLAAAPLGAVRRAARGGAPAEPAAGGSRRRQRAPRERARPGHARAHAGRAARGA